MDAHPPSPGGIVQPNFHGVEEALDGVTFPISKRDLLDQVGEATAFVHGRNVDLHVLIKDLHDDFFEDEEEFRRALESQYARFTEEGDAPEPPLDPALGAGPLGRLDRDSAHIFEPE